MEVRHELPTFALDTRHGQVGLFRRRRGRIDASLVEPVR